MCVEIGGTGRRTGCDRLDRLKTGNLCTSRSAEARTGRGLQPFRPARPAIFYNSVYKLTNKHNKPPLCSSCVMFIFYALIPPQIAGRAGRTLYSPGVARLSADRLYFFEPACSRSSRI